MIVSATRRRSVPFVFEPWRERRSAADSWPRVVTLSTSASHGGKPWKSSSRTCSKMPKLKLLILDANVFFPYASAVHGAPTQCPRGVVGATRVRNRALHPDEIGSY